MLGIKLLVVLSIAFCVEVDGRSSQLSYCPNRNGVYPLAGSNCKEYIVCVNGTAYHKICSSGLVYNAVKRSCDLKKNVRCNPNEQTPSLNQVPAPREEICPRQNGTFPVSCDDCSKYMICQKGKASIMDCPPGLAYDQNKHSCDWSRNVVCNSKNTPSSTPCPTPAPASTPSTVQTPAPASTPAPTPGPSPVPGFPIHFNCQQRNGYNAIVNKCDTYIICQENVAYEASCPHGLQFNPEARWPDYACSRYPRVNCVGRTVEQNSKPWNQYPWQYGFYPMSGRW